MKKQIQLILFILFCISTMGYGQYKTLWEKTFKNNTNPVWLGTGSDNNVRGFAFGIFDGQKRILVATRAVAVGNQIIILDAATGDSLGKLKGASIISGGSGAVLCDIEVSEDGQIFAGNMTTGHNTSPFKVYRWKSLNDSTPKVILSYSDTVGLGSGASIRLGDKFSVVGKISDGSFRLYAASATTTSGRANNVIRFKYNPDKDTIEFEKVIKLKIPAITSAGSAAVFPVGIGDTNFFWKANGENLRYFDKNGNQLSVSASTQVPTGSNAMRVFQFDKRMYVFLYRYGSTTENGAFYDVTYGSARAGFVHFTPSMYKNANGNGAGDVAIDYLGNGKVRVYVLGTNNGVGGYETEFFPLQNISEARKQTIANDKPDKLNQVVHVKGVVTSNNFDAKGAFYMQDNTGGIYIYRTSQLNWVPQIGDEIEVYGKIAQFNGLTEILPSCDSIIFVSKKQRPLPLPITANIMNTKGEELEGKLVVIHGLFKIDTATVYPAAGQSKNVLYTTGKGDTIQVRFVNAKNIFTNAKLPYVTDIIGNVGQFKQTDPRIGAYQLFPSSNNDLLPPNVENVKVHWERSVEKGNLPPYFDSLASEVSMAFGVPKGKPKLYVLSNAKNQSKIFVHNPFDGSIIKNVPVPQNEKLGSLFVIDDILYAVATNKDSVGTIKIFQYKDDNLLPKLFQTIKVNGFAGYRVNAKKLEDSTVFITIPVNKVAKFYTLKIKVGQPNVIDSVMFPAKLAGGLPSIVKLEGNNPSYLIKSPGKLLYSLSNTGTILDSVYNIMIPESATDINFYEENVTNQIKNNFIVSYIPNQDSLNTNSLILTDVTDINGGKFALNKYQLPKFGTMNNFNGIGSIVIAKFPQNEPNKPAKQIIYLLSPNNGIVALGGIDLPKPWQLKFRKMFAVWGKFANNKPKYFGDNLERGATIGKLGNQWAYFIVSRNGGPKIVVHNPFTGDSLGILPKPAVDKGYFPLNVVGAAKEGDIFVSNMTLNAKANNEFTVYRYFTTSNKPDSHKVVISYVSGEATARMGDAISVYGSLADNSLKIFAGIANLNKFVIFSTTDNGNTFIPEEITIEDQNYKGTIPYACPFDDSTYLFKVYSKQIIRVNKQGKILEKTSSTVVPDGATTVNVFEKLGRKYMATYQCDYNGYSPTPLEKAFVYDVTDGLSEAQLVAETPSLGNTKNGNATGNVTVFPNLNKYKENQETEDFDIYLLGTNNGIARFTTSPNVIVSMYDTLKYYDKTKPALYKIGKGGWYAGPNYYGDLGKAQRFDHQANDKLYGFKIYYGIKNVIGDADTLTYYVRKTVNDSDPKKNAPDKGSVLAKITTTTAELDTMGIGNIYIFDNPITVDGPVFITVEWKPTYNDTFAIVCDQHRGFTGVPVNYRVWEMWDDANWYAWQSGSIYTNINSDLWVETYYQKAPVVGIDKDGNFVPETYVLYQNYPNPFNPTTTIKFALKTDALVNLKIYNILGQEVATLVNSEMTAGIKTVNFNANSLASGVYIYRLEVVGKDGSKFVNAKKMMLLK